MRFVGSTSTAIWKQRVLGGVGSFVMYALLLIVGVLKLGTLETVALGVSLAVYAAAYSRGDSRVVRWLVAAFDAGLLLLMVRATGMTQSPFVMLAPVWFFGVALANLSDGNDAPVPWMIALALIALLGGGYGGENFLLYAVITVVMVTAMAGAVLTLTSERTAGRADPLLGMMLNRSAGLALLEAMTKAGEPFTLAFVDLGEFKQVNDRHGHKVGDEVLLEIGKRLRSSVDRQDLVARYGGDEFLIAVRDPGTLERVRARLEPMIQTSAGLLSVRADLGDVPFERGEDLDKVLERADRAMYQRKAAAKLSRLQPA
jgi:diguanylate cyclase (GGDEF)-like protein